MSFEATIWHFQEGLEPGTTLIGSIRSPRLLLNPVCTSSCCRRRIQGRIAKYLGAPAHLDVQTQALHFLYQNVE